MKIISKYKDYYDYLTGVYGVDPKLVLDRRKHVNPQIISPQMIVLYICGKRIEGFYDGKFFYYGDDLESVGVRMENPYYKRVWSSGPKEFVRIKYRPYNFDPIKTIDICPYMRNTDINDKEDCPILYGSLHHSKEVSGGCFPKLSDLNVASILPPEVIYQMLVQWLSEKITKTEIIIDDRNDVEKLQSKGFDKKSSFRPKIKI